MADNTTTPIADGTAIATDEIGGAHYQRVKPAFGVEGSAVDVSATNPLPVTIGAGPFAVTGTFYQATQPVSIAGTVTVSGALTDTQLRATPVPVSGTVAVTGTFFQATQPVSAASLPLPAGAATNATVATLLTEATFTTRQPTTGPKAASGSVPMVLSNDQDPVLDHANAVIAAITNASSTAITPPAGSRYGVFLPTVDMFIRTDGSAASASAAGSLKLFANQPRDLPIVGGTAVTAIVASGTGELRITPSKSRT